MGILEKLSDIRRKKLDEDWRETAKEYAKSKKVGDIHRNRLKSLDFDLRTKYGYWQVQITFSVFSSDKASFNVTVVGQHYVGSKWLDTASDVKKYLFDGGLTDLIRKDIREETIKKLNNDKITAKEMKEIFDRATREMEYLQNAIDINIDEEDLDKKLHRYVTYFRAMNNRSSKSDNLHRKAENEFRKEHKFEVGDIVYGETYSGLRDSKPYKVVGVDKEFVSVEPENGRGRSYKVPTNSVFLDYSQVSDAINDPDNPKYNKFDKQKYMMDRYGSDREFEESVQLLSDCGMIVESTISVDDEKKILDKYSKFDFLGDLEAQLKKDTESEPDVTFGRRSKIVWIKTDPFTLVGTYRFDDDLGEYEVKLQSAKPSNR